MPGQAPGSTPSRTQPWPFRWRAAASGSTVCEAEQVLGGRCPVRLPREVVARLPLEPVGLLEAGRVPHPAHERLTLQGLADAARRRGRLRRGHVLRRWHPDRSSRAFLARASGHRRRCPVDTAASRPWFADMSEAQRPEQAAVAPLRLALDPGRARVALRARAEPQPRVAPWAPACVEVLVLGSRRYARRRRAVSPA